MISLSHVKEKGNGRNDDRKAASPPDHMASSVGKFLEQNEHKRKRKKKRKEKENDLLEEGKLRNRILKLPLARSSKRSAGLTVTHVEKPTEEKYSMAVDAGPL